MTTKEITELRKSGRPQEALVAAEENFETYKDKMAAQSLFWCLYDKSKQVPNELAELYERMQSLCNSYCAGDDIMHKTLDSMAKRLIPHAVELRTALDSAKNNGDAIALCHTINKYYEANDLDEQLYGDYGWLIYYALKQTPAQDVHNRKKLLFRYLNLHLEAPSVLHSLILREAVVVEKTTPLEFLFSTFIEMWDLSNLRDEDWGQYKTDEGNVLPSLVEKMIAVYVKEMRTNHSQASEAFCEVFEKALKRYTTNQNMPYFKARILISQGKQEEAMRYYRDMILRFPMKAYLWDQLSELVEDTNVKIGLLCRAINADNKDEFVGNIRLRLATILLEKNLLPQAKYELEQYAVTYHKQGWPIKSAYYELSSKVSQVECPESNAQLYEEYSVYADAFIYNDLPTVYAIKLSDKQVDDKKKQGRKITKWILRSEREKYALLKPRKYGIDNRMPNGALFEVKIQQKKIVWIKPVKEHVLLDWIKTVEGDVVKRMDRNGNTYAIIGGVYVGKQLLTDIQDGQMVSIMAIKQDDGRWLAINLI